MAASQRTATTDFAGESVADQRRPSGQSSAAKTRRLSNAGARVADTLADGTDVRAGRNGQRDVRVALVMDADTGHTGP